MGQSWSGIRKRLEEDLLCDSLKGRVRYFITKYKNSHDESGRVAIRVDDKEIIQGHIFNFYKGYMELEERFKTELKIPERHWNGKEEENHLENLEVEDYIEEIRLDDGLFDVWQFTDAVDEFLSMSIEDSLRSSNPLIKLLAILDRRVGKRTLRRIKESTEEQPAWLEYFYNLRFDAEGLN